MNWLDFVLLGILALSAFNGFVRGFLRSVTGLVSVALGFVVALKLFRPVSDYLDFELGFGDRLAQFLMEQWGVPAGTVATGSMEAWPAVLSKSSVLPDFLGVLGGDPGMNLGTETTVRALASSALDVVSFLAVFILVIIITSLMLSTVSMVPLLAPLDKAGGFCFGLLRGFLFGLVVVAVVRFLETTGIFFGSNFLSAAVNSGVLAPSYAAFLNYLWSLILPAALDWPGMDRFLPPGGVS